MGTSVGAVGAVVVIIRTTYEVVTYVSVGYNEILAMPSLRRLWQYHRPHATIPPPAHAMPAAEVALRHV